MKSILIKSIVFTIVYAIATILISFFNEGKEVLSTISERWYEYIVLFPVLVWFNYFIEKKNRKRETNKFYKDL